MSSTPTPKPPAGSILWHDLTADDAPRIRDFYRKVVGMTSSDVDMGGYADYNMKDADGATTAGICHARGANAGVPPQWLVYFSVTDLDASIKAALDAGGAVLHGPRSMGAARFAVIRDPAGAVCGLFQS
jgi:uncharacterized protein